MTSDLKDTKFLVETLKEQARHTLPQLLHDVRVHTQSHKEGDKKDRS